MKNKVLIIDVNPFGALTDTVKWAEYLKEEWNVTVLCYAAKDGRKAKADGIKLIQLKNFKKRQIKAMYFILYSIIYLLFYNGKIVVEFFPMCEIYKKIFPKKRMLLDIRTLSVSSDENTRKALNLKIRNACQYYDKVTAISEGVVRQIGVPGIEVLPLGSDVISPSKKKFNDSIRLIYVGTFTNRNIEKTIEGVISYHKANHEVPINYQVIGYGNNGEENMFQHIIEKNNANDYVHIVGKVPHAKLKTYFDNSNVGFSFVPITDYYNDQPPTKTYEYCLSGIYCIGTATSINKQLLNDNNGILIADSSEGVKIGLEVFWENRNKLDSKRIKKTLELYTWRNIVLYQFSPILKAL